MLKAYSAEVVTCNNVSGWLVVARELMLEIERLHRRQGKDSEAGSVSDDDWSKEEEEPAAREEVLQAYNQQLEVQLRRLRQVLHQVSLLQFRNAESLVEGWVRL